MSDLTNTYFMHCCCWAMRCCRRDRGRRSLSSTVVTFHTYLHFTRYFHGVGCCLSLRHLPGNHGPCDAHLHFANRPSKAHRLMYHCNARRTPSHIFLFFVSAVRRATLPLDRLRLRQPLCLVPALPNKAQKVRRDDGPDNVLQRKWNSSRTSITSSSRRRPPSNSEFVAATQNSQQSNSRIAPSRRREERGAASK